MIPNKLPKLPKKLFNQEWDVTIYQDGISEDGAPFVAATVNTNCFFDGKAYQVMSAEKQIIRLEGKLIALGDLFPTLQTISSGIAEKGELTYKIYKSQRPHNPDGTVYATILELM